MPSVVEQLTGAVGISTIHVTSLTPGHVEETRVEQLLQEDADRLFEVRGFGGHRTDDPAIEDDEATQLSSCFDRDGLA
jgi:hypothetical protein